MNINHIDGAQFCGIVWQKDLKTSEDQWRRDTDIAMKNKEELEAALAASEKREAVNQSRVQDLHIASEQLRKREQATAREKIALEVRLGRALKTSVKWKRQADQWQREIRRKANEATCDQADAPGGSKRSRKARCVEALPTMLACLFCFMYLHAFSGIHRHFGASSRFTTHHPLT